MTDREVMQQALDAWNNPMGMKDLCVAMDALRTALEQQAEPVGEVTAAVDGAFKCEFSQHLPVGTKLYTAPQQQAEPVAWMDREGDLYKMPEILEWAPPHTMLYTAPPQRQWVGLTDEDVNRESAMIAQKMKLAFHAGMYVAQQILKEKNT